MSEDESVWSPHLFTLEDFPEEVHSWLQQLHAHQPMLIDRVNGDEVYVRRKGRRFQCGLLWERIDAEQVITELS